MKRYKSKRVEQISRSVVIYFTVYYQLLLLLLLFGLIPHHASENNTMKFQAFDSPNHAIGAVSHNNK